MTVTVYADDYSSEKEIIRLLNEHCVKNSYVPFNLDTTIQKEKYIYNIQQFAHNNNAILGIDKQYTYTGYYLKNMKNQFSIFSVDKNYGCQISSLNLNRDILIMLLRATFKVDRPIKRKIKNYGVVNSLTFNKKSKLHGSIINISEVKSKKTGSVAIDIRYTPVEFFSNETPKVYKVLERISTHMNNNSIGKDIGNGWVFYGSTVNKKEITLKYMDKKTKKQFMRLAKNNKQALTNSFNYLKQQIKSMNIKSICPTYREFFNEGMVFKDIYMSSDKTILFEYSITQVDCKGNR